MEKKLLKQIEEGILERVDESSGPTPWISNLVIVPKEKGVSKSSFSKSVNKEQQYEFAIRLTCDNRSVNKAIKRIRYPTKTVEDLIYLVNGGTKFSKLDIIKAFHQAILAKESRNLSTITTHIDLLRYRRLHMGISCALEINFYRTVAIYSGENSWSSKHG